MPLNPNTYVKASLELILFLSVMVLFAAGHAAAGASASDQISTVSTKAGEQIQAAGQATQSGLEELWRRIDEKRLKNRTPDQLVGWLIIGLLVGGIIHHFSKLSWFATILLGLS